MVCYVTAIERYVDACRACDMLQFSEHEVGGDRKADSLSAGTQNDTTPPASVAIGEALHVFICWAASDSSQGSKHGLESLKKSPTTIHSGICSFPRR